MNKKRQHLKGSVLVFSLLVLTMLLSVAVSSAVVVIADKDAARSTDKSVLSFQIADGAAENVLRRIYHNNPSGGPLDDATPDDLADNLYGSDIDCDNGVISGRLPSSSGTFDITFFKNDGTSSIGCGDGNWRALLVSMKIIGTYAGTTRAIQVGVEP